MLFSVTALSAALRYVELIMVHIHVILRRSKDAHSGNRLTRTWEFRIAEYDASAYSAIRS